MKKFISLLCCTALILTSFVFVSPTESHAEPHWANSYLKNLVRLNIMRGDDSGNLRPDSDITRAEFVAMMNRAFGYSKKGKISFNDVAEDAWYYDDIRIAKDQGYFNGIYPDTAGPDTPLKREEAVALICRALKIEGTENSSLFFSDSRSFSGWSKEYINASVEKEFLNGYPDETFRPADHMKRGEMAKVLSEVAGEIVKDSGSNYIGYANKNVSLVKTGASLRSTIIPGDLYLTAGLGTGYSTLDNVVVNGDLIISGTGNAESGKVSVILKDSDIRHLIIDSKSSDIMSVRAEGGSVIEQTTIKSNSYIEEDTDRNIAFKDVILKGPSGTKLNMSGNFENVKIKAENNQLSLGKGKIEALTVDEDAVKGSVFLEKETSVGALLCDTATTVTGTGKVDQVVINAEGCNISMLPEKIYIRPGIKAIINGKTMTSLDGEANNASPEFMSGYPKYMDLTATNLKLLVKVNKPGKVYWAVKNIDLVNAGMSESEIKQPDKRYVVKSGNQIVVGEKEVSIPISGLASGVNYEYYVLFEDLKGNTTRIEKEKFRTVDIVAPKFLNGTPRIVSSTKDSFKMLAMPSKNVSLAWAVLPSKAVPPTIESLSELKVSGALGKGRITGMEMNDPKEIFITGTDGKALSENEMYDIYMVLKDDSGNLSKLSKTIGKTGDDTPPEFMEGYPWNEPGKVNSLTIRHMANEESTLFWAVYPFDFKFPPVENYDSKPEAEKKELAIRAITTGQKALKHGKQNVKLKKDDKFIISGLDKATPYDIYFVLMDKAGNYSNVSMIKGAKTLDKDAPKAKMEFDKVIGENPLITSNITVKFDEIVYYDGPEKDTRLLFVPVADRVAILRSMFSVHDLLSITKPDYLTNIDYSKAVIGEKDGQTYVSFGQECFGGGKGLLSGGMYQFELNNVVDSEGNAMSQAHRLTSFKVVPPQIYLSRFNGKLEFEEIGFSLKKADLLNSDKNFDIIISSDKLIVFDLWTRPGGSEAFTKKASDIRIDAGRGRSITGMITGEDFAEFEAVKDTDYKLVLKNFDAFPVDKKESWNGALNLSAIAVIGTKADLNNLSTSVLNKNNPMDIVKKNKDTVVVSNPEVFTTTRVYADTAQPELIGRVKFEQEDTTVNIVTMTDKAAEIYYVIVSRDDLIKKAGPPVVYKETPTVDQIMAGKPAYINSKTGTIRLPAGQVEVQEFVKDLKPNTQYKFFYVIKGLGSDDLKVEDTIDGNTLDLDTPDFTTKSPIVPRVDEFVPTGIGNKNSAGMKGTANIGARAYWVMYSSGLYPDKPVGGQLVPHFSVDQVMELSNGDGTVVDAGNFLITPEGDLNKDKEGIQFEFTCKNMESTKSYDVFLVLENEYSGAKSEKVFKYANLRSKDEIPPHIYNDLSTVIYKKNVVNDVTYYSGGISIRFSKPLYYKNSLNAEHRYPLTKDKLFNMAMQDTTNPDSNIMYGTYYVPQSSMFSFDPFIGLRGIPYTTEDAGAQPITGFDLKFERIVHGSVISINAEIYDRAGWHSGQFSMRFVAPKDEEPHFEVKFPTRKSLGLEE